MRTADEPGSNDTFGADDPDKKSPGSRQGFRNPGEESENQNVTLQLLM